MQKRTAPNEDIYHARRSLLFQIFCLVMIAICAVVFIRSRDARGVYRSDYEITDDGTRIEGGDTEITLKSGGVAIMTFGGGDDSASVRGRWSKSGSEITIAWEGGLGRITYEWSPGSLVYDPPGKAKEVFDRVSH